MSTIKVKSLKTQFNDIEVYTQSLKVKDAVLLYYVAERGKSDEEGAVQRILNTRRISKIREYVLEGNIFLNTFFLNWVEQHEKPVFDEKTGVITIPLIRSAAQVIDGQHRLVGLREALKVDDKIGEKEILVSMSMDLTTKEAARIFLNINTEQRPVPESLIYDLYKETEAADHLVNRARDIAEMLNTDIDSPYYNAVRFPGNARGAGSIDFATVVNSLEKHLMRGGSFDKYNLPTLNLQKLVIVNYFNAIKYFYDLHGMWNNLSKNPFLKNIGFSGAIDFLTSELLKEGAKRRSFKVETLKEILDLNEIPLLLQHDLKGMGGPEQRKVVFDWLSKPQLQDLAKVDELEF